MIRSSKTWQAVAALRRRRARADRVWHDRRRATTHRRTAAAAAADRCGQPPSSGLDRPDGGLGQPIIDGVKLAIDQYNEDPDCKVELEVFDSQGDPDKATSLATQIAGDDAIIGLVGPALLR